MARSSRGEDARFSFWKQGFDSPTGYSSLKESQDRLYKIQCGVEQLVARRAHNPKVISSSLVPATKEKLKDTSLFNGPLVYRLGRQIFILEIGVRFPCGLQSRFTMSRAGFLLFRTMPSEFLEVLFPEMDISQ